ncbi:MAG: nuclear transport factor 2 family protein [Robiginitomaculum sp.]|nr:nuclear transport factor 2 family protein [Robiginitomaculum sp.]MDQ7077032.1 nuclear transport factor 2 family protein [Robiginitomaculum sp.]
MKMNPILAFGALAFMLSANMAIADQMHQQDTVHHDKADMAMDGPTQVLRSYGKAIADKNLVEMGKYVAANGNDFTIFEGSGANTGWADYRDHHLAPEFANPDLTFHRYEYTNIKTHSEGNMAFSTFSIEMAYTYKGENKKRTGRGTAIFERRNGKWKIIHLQTS